MAHLDARSTQVSERRRHAILELVLDGCGALEGEVRLKLGLQLRDRARLARTVSAQLFRILLYHIVSERVGRAQELAVGPGSTC